MRSPTLSSVAGKARSRSLAGPIAEPLEQRTVLSLNNFPTIGDLLNPNDTVVRLQTNFGDIDFELFDTAAPITVANFLKYIKDGDFDKSFFHRYATSSGNPFVIQGGHSRLHGPTTTGQFNGTGTANQAWEPIPTDPPITNEFNQSNLIRTVAMARVGGQVNSATSQFFINLANNTFLDTVDQGFTVFGRVATDASWAVVQSIISGLTVVNQGGVFAELPTKSGSGFNGTNGVQATNVTEEQLVTIRDVEVIKPNGIAAFYTYRVYYPEGFAGSTINEALPLGNPGSTAVKYQVIVRSETRDALPTPAADFWYRDKVINDGILPPNWRGGVQVSHSQNPQNNLVPRRGKPYAIEVWATGPVAAALSHYDFGSSTIHSFTRTTDTTWTLPEVRKGTDLGDVIVWDNPGELPVTVTLNFYQSNGAAPITFMFTTEAFRRGGVSLAQIPASQLPDNDYSVVVTSNLPIIAAMTHYNTGAVRGAATQIGITGSGARTGVLPLASNGAAGSGVADTVSIFNPGGSAAIVTIIARFDDGSPEFTISPPQLIIPAGARRSFTMPDVTALQNKRFSLIYSAGVVNVYASTRHAEHMDETASPFAYTAALNHDIAEGFMNGARAGNDLFEHIGIYNPNGSVLFSGQAQDANVTIRFLFTDGFVLAVDYVIASDGVKIVDLGTLAPLLAQNANNRYFYAINIVSDVPVVAMMDHYDLTLGGLQPSGGDLYLGTQRGGVVSLHSL